MIKLVRLEFNKNETIGVLKLFDDVLCYTLELPWIDNQRQKSCIPLGVYECQLFNSQKFGECWQIMNVPNRDGILIHNGNTHRDVKGCIILGSGIGYLNNDRAVFGSKNAIDEFMLKTKEFTNLKIEIKEA